MSRTRSSSWWMRSIRANSRRRRRLRDENARAHCPVGVDASRLRRLDTLLARQPPASLMRAPLLAAPALPLLLFNPAQPIFRRREPLLHLRAFTPAFGRLGFHLPFHDHQMIR